MLKVIKYVLFYIILKCPVLKEEKFLFQIIELLNEAAIGNDKTKVENLYKVQEMILNKSPNLLDNFLEEIIGFQTDKSADVRKAVVAFIEEASKKEPDILHRIVGNLVMFLQDNSVQVQKRAVQATSHVYRAVLMWVSKSRSVTSSVERTWNLMNQAKALITQMVDNDNDGIRTHAVKFLEAVVLLQTYPEPESMRRNNDFSLEDVPMALKIARRRKLEEEAIMTLDLLIKFHGSAHISSVNLMACMGSLTLIAKMRPQYMPKVITAMEALHTNLPPTLSKSQVSSVRKHLKLQLLTLLKHPASADVHGNITTLLMDLGATQQETGMVPKCSIIKNSPKPDEVRKRQKRLEALAQSQPVAKRPRIEMTDLLEP
ncbi:hypothetical protein B566_EDAN010521 [Ephemera danica]|nr:hypothetical protein B566_EDAN010521 [Ephemera danica]